MTGKCEDCEYGATIQGLHGSEGSALLCKSRWRIPDQTECKCEEYRLADTARHGVCCRTCWYYVGEYRSCGRRMTFDHGWYGLCEKFMLYRGW